jgi:peroxiredoxin family protein
MRITNETGDIKCLTEKGEVRWFSPYIVNSTNVLRDNKIKVFEAVEELKPLIKDDLVPKELTIDDYTKAKLAELLTEAKIEFNQLDKKEVLYNLYINQNN